MWEATPTTHSTLQLEHGLLIFTLFIAELERWIGTWVRSFQMIKKNTQIKTDRIGYSRTEAQAGKGSKA